jgi:hypothetical protein
VGQPLFIRAKAKNIRDESFFPCNDFIKMDDGRPFLLI